MPYKSRYVSSRRTSQRNRTSYRRRPRRTPFSFGRIPIGDVGAAAWRGVKYLKGLVNAEKHKFDTSITTSVSTTQVVTHLSAVAQGDAENTRTGLSYLARSVSIMGHLTAVSGTVMRMVVVQDNQQVADTAPTYGQVFESSSTQSFLNVDTLGRFKVLYNQQYVFNADNLTQTFNIHIPLKHHIRYNGTAGTDIQKGGIYLIQLGTNDPGSPIVQATQARLSFYDN